MFDWICRFFGEIWSILFFSINLVPNCSTNCEQCSLDTDDKSESFLFNLKIFDFQIEHLHFQMISFELCLIWLNPHSNSTNILIGLHLNWPATYSTQIVAQSKFSWLKFPTIFEIWQNESIGIVGFNSVIFQHERCSSQRNVLFEVENWNFLLHGTKVQLMWFLLRKWMSWLKNAHNTLFRDCCQLQLYRCKTVGSFKIFFIKISNLFFGNNSTTELCAVYVVKGL